MDYKKIEKRIGYSFRDKSLIDLAFTHKSISAEKNYERLEFLGDAVIGAIVTEYLYKNYQNLNEGELSKYRASLVRLDALYNIAQNIKISEFIVKERDNSSIEIKNKNKRIIGNVYEAVIGAIFLDSSFDKAREILLRHILKVTPDINGEILKNSDFKTELQEIVQKETGKTPRYFTINKEGPDHNAVFTICVKIDDEIFALGRGNTKKDAEQNGAKIAIRKFMEKINDKK